MSAKGWCPGVLRPMEVEDGLLVRVKPLMSCLSAAQVAALCETALRCGSGELELTSRANVQIRGVSAAAHPDLVDALTKVGLADASREIEAKRQIMMTPLWSRGAESAALHDRVVRALPDMLTVPEKLGIAIDTGRAAVLREASADFRFERVLDGFILRADGAEAGQRVTLDGAGEALCAMAAWFAGTGAKRMRDVADQVPEAWQQVPMAARAGALQPGALPNGQVVAVPKGQIRAERLSQIVTLSGARGLRLMPRRMVLLEGVQDFEADDLILHMGDTRLQPVPEGA